MSQCIMPTVHVGTQTDLLWSVDVGRLKSALSCLVSNLEELGTTGTTRTPEPAALSDCRKLAEGKHRQCASYVAS